MIKGVYGVDARLPRYGARDWTAYADFLADHGVAMWVFYAGGGQFRSRRYPGACAYRTRGVPDAPAVSEAALNEVFAHCARRGMAVVVNSGLFGWEGLADLVVNERPDLQAEGVSHPGMMCLSQPETLEIAEEYFLEMAERFPAASGVGMEVACEMGHCRCARCAGREGEIELGFLDRFAARLRERRPDARIVWFAGYRSHADDPAYYRRLAALAAGRAVTLYWVRKRNDYLDDAGVRRSFSDPTTYGRFETTNLTIGPARRIYNQTFAELREEWRFVRAAGLDGYVCAFEPQVLFAPSCSPYACGWYAVGRPDASARPWRFLPVEAAMAAFDALGTDPDLPDDALLEELNRRLLGGRGGPTETGALLSLCRIYGENSWWLDRTNMFKDAVWCRSGGEWTFYYGHPNTRERPPAALRECAHPVELVARWEADGRVPDAWIGFHLRLEKHRRVYGDELRRIRALPGAGAQRLRECAGEMLRNVLFVADDEAANRRYDAFMAETISRLTEPRERYEELSPYAYRPVAGVFNE